ncbi:LLM class flavin-dependent oxidoreductase, partial [Frankia sp. CNm7]|uniref:LLM class flavin-dependent oxidoreductase n=1 Tax=Frankia nepalensis TaxID=1836974 RepID=UPI001932FD15
MPIHPHWFLPTSGDSRNLDAATLTHEANRTSRTAGIRPPDLDYLAEIAKAADRLGYEAVLTPTGTWCEDAWLTTAALLRETKRLKFLVAFRPGLVTPTLAAQMAATYQRLSGGRLLLNVVTGGETEEQRRFGDWLDKDTRYARTAEFLQIVRGAWGDEPFDFSGEHYQVVGATTRRPFTPPEIFFGGASPAAERVAARHADVYLLWGETPAQVTERLDRMRGLAAQAGRELRFGYRVHVITRDTSEAAWAVADDLLAGLDPATIRLAHSLLSQAESVGQQRMTALHGGGTDDLVIAPNLWAGFGLVRPGAGTALVGSHSEVADRLEELHALGVDHFILSGHPHLEEAYWFAEGVLPLLRQRGLLAGAEGAAARGPASAAPGPPPAGGVLTTPRP